MYHTLAAAKEACSKEIRCIGVENPTCDNFSSRSCSAMYYQSTAASKPYESKAILSNYGSCIYIKAERYGKRMFKNIIRLINTQII